MLNLTASRPSVPRSSSIVLSWGARAALWRALTNEANVAFKRGHDVRARVLYEAALAEAEALFAAAAERLSDEAIDLAPTAYNLSCHNVAELARRQKDHATEGIFLHRAYERLVSIAESPSAPLPLRACCIRPLSAASASLIGYFAEQGKRAAAVACTERAKAATFEVLRLSEGAAS